jgi:hypothetical protein
MGSNVSSQNNDSIDMSLIFANNRLMNNESRAYIADIGMITPIGVNSAMTVASYRGHDGSPVHTIYSSMNGEHYWAKEYGVAMSRNPPLRESKIAHPADCVADLGTATGAVLTGMATKHLLLYTAKALIWFIAHQTPPGVRRFV